MRSPKTIFDDLLTGRQALVEFSGPALNDKQLLVAYDILIRRELLKGQDRLNLPVNEIARSTGENISTIARVIEALENSFITFENIKITLADKIQFCERSGSLTVTASREFNTLFMNLSRIG